MLVDVNHKGLKTGDIVAFIVDDGKLLPFHIKTLLDTFTRDIKALKETIKLQRDEIERLNALYNERDAQFNAKINRFIDALRTEEV